MLDGYEDGDIHVRLSKSNRFRSNRSRAVPQTNARIVRQRHPLLSRRSPTMIDVVEHVPQCQQCARTYPHEHSHANTTAFGCTKSCHDRSRRPGQIPAPFVDRSSRTPSATRVRPGAAHLRSRSLLPTIPPPSRKKVRQYNGVSRYHSQVP